MSSPLWTADEIVRATGGSMTGAGFAAGGVSIDTRTIEPGDLFVALGGVRDGHEFIETAMTKGAAGALVSRETAGPAVRVSDTLKALEAMGEFARDRAPAARRCAVTGSVGKTSVTQAIAAGLALAGRSHTSVKSYNNHIGVPLTLARMPRETERAVFEVGMNHAEEIRPLTKMIRPQAAAITTVGPVHIENFPDGELGVARAKAEIFDGMPAGGEAVLNADNAWFNLLSTEAARCGQRVASFGSAPGCDAQLLAFEPAEGAMVEALVRGRRVRFPIRMAGVHWGLNSLAALLTLTAVDVDLEVAIEALSGFEPLDGRGAERHVALPGGRFLLIDESYNANPVSMSAALASLGARPAEGLRIVALTDMLELGEGAPRYHAELAAGIEAARVDLVFCAGPLMRSLWDALPATRRGGYADAAAGLVEQIEAAVSPGDMVMVKGSKGSQAASIVAALAEWNGVAEGASSRGKAG
jgi:UDP-N-acetylmuramoyl-tripeptide--D-alanyl-D-alanine ligase